MTSALGALEEIVGKEGILIREEPGSEVYLDKFCEAVDRLLTDESYFQSLSQKALEKSAQNDWKSRGEELMRFVLETGG